MEKKLKKIGRNDPCPCGSNKKFKKCCMGTKKYDKFGKPTPPPEVLKAAKEFMNLPKEPFEKGGFLTGRPFIDIADQDLRLRAVGSRVYKRPLHETFHAFILDIFAQALGYKWLIKERLKTQKDKHLIVQWYEEMGYKLDKVRDPSLPENHLFSIKQSGNIRSLLAMAYDYYSLFHCNAKTLPKLLNRLKNKDNFQGAKYEIAVGGLAVRAGFDIKWINLKEKHCEFIGIHKITKDKVAFEAKSHHRAGVLGKSGADFDSDKVKIKIIEHIEKALSQFKKDIPLIIFDDLNLPITPEADFNKKKWFREVEEALVRSGFLENSTKTNFGALFITNFSWHFHTSLDNLKENEVVAHFHTGGRYSLNPKSIHLLHIATKQYGFVPAKLEERKQQSQKR
jgi:hypothetical protein